MTRYQKLEEAAKNLLNAPDTYLQEQRRALYNVLSLPEEPPMTVDAIERIIIDDTYAQCGCGDYEPEIYGTEKAAESIHSVLLESMKGGGK